MAVQDGNGNPLAGAIVEATTDKKGVNVSSGIKTDKDGHATVTLTSTTMTVSDITLSAGTGAQEKIAADKKVSFVADSQTAKLTEVRLDDSETEKLADGKSTFRYVALVKDAGGNALQGVNVSWSRSGGNSATELQNENGTSSSESMTDSEGKAVIVLRSTTTVIKNVQVSAALDSGITQNADHAVSFTQTIDVKLNGTTNSLPAIIGQFFEFNATVKGGKSPQAVTWDINPTDKARAVTLINKATGEEISNGETTNTDNNGLTTLQVYTKGEATSELSITVTVKDISATAVDKIKFTKDQVNFTGVTINGRLVTDRNFSTVYQDAHFFVNTTQPLGDNYKIKATPADWFSADGQDIQVTSEPTGDKTITLNLISTVDGTVADTMKLTFDTWLFQIRELTDASEAMTVCSAKGMKVSDLKNLQSLYSLWGGSDWHSTLVGSATPDPNKQGYSYALDMSNGKIQTVADTERMTRACSN